MSALIRKSNVSNMPPIIPQIDTTSKREKIWYTPFKKERPEGLMAISKVTIVTIVPIASSRMPSAYNTVLTP